MVVVLVPQITYPSVHGDISVPAVSTDSLLRHELKVNGEKLSLLE
jgi:hypothetical protein